jgi:hypothetical protein
MGLLFGSGRIPDNLVIGLHAFEKFSLIEIDCGLIQKRGRIETKGLCSMTRQDRGPKNKQRDKKKDAARAVLSMF